MDKVIIAGKEFHTLVAMTEEEQVQGLMWKPWPPPIMAFPFDSMEKRSFWMKNTISPLDIIFCQAGKIIGIYSGEPFSKDFLGPNEPSDLVIEFPAGTAKANNFSIGDSVKLSLGISSLARKFTA